MGAWYCTRESVKAAVDVKDTARANAQIDRLIEDASRSVDRLCHRTFYPWQGTKYFDWPDRDQPTPWRLWLGANEITTLDELTSAGVPIDLADVVLQPADSGPPYNRIELSRGSSSSFNSGDTPQRNIAATGLFMGCPYEERPVFTLAEALDASETEVDVSNSAAVGVGSILRVDSERVIVVEKLTADLGVTVAGSGLTDKKNAVQLTLSATTAAVQAGEVLLIEGERCEVIDVAGTVCTVSRATDGSVLAAHTAGAAVYGFRTLRVARGALGTVSAAHGDASPVYEWVPPGPVSTLAVAETLNSLAQENSAYVRVVGSGENARNASGAGLESKRCQVYDGYALKARTGAI